jgi:hypothetical protein
MTVETITAVLLIAVPIVFTLWLIRIRVLLVV